jgi:hypothetical protein
MYIISSNAINKTLTAKLSSGEIVPANNQCLSFWYYIPVHYTTPLRVYTRNTCQSTNTIYTLNSPKISSWTKVQIELKETSMFNVVFGVTNTLTIGEMALDDISIVNTPCKGN